MPAQPEPILDIDCSEPIFIPAEWIGTGKNFPSVSELPHCARVFAKAGIPAGLTGFLSAARVSQLHPLKIGDFGIMYTAHQGVMVCKGKVFLTNK